jgi:hypothetical protein
MAATVHPIQEMAVPVEGGTPRAIPPTTEYPCEELLHRILRIQAQAIWGSNEDEGKPGRIPAAAPVSSSRDQLTKK